MKSGYRTIQVDPSARTPEDFMISVQDDGLELDRFAQAMQMVQNLSDSKPFRPEWLFNKEMPEEVRLFLRNTFEQRLTPITTGLDVSKLSDEDLVTLSPIDGETLDSYRSRVTKYLDDHAFDED